MVEMAGVAGIEPTSAILETAVLPIKRRPYERTLGIVCLAANLQALRLVSALQSPNSCPLIHLTSGARLVQVGS